jgi:hypothetical protein
VVQWSAGVYGLPLSIDLEQPRWPPPVPLARLAVRAKAANPSGVATLLVSARRTAEPSAAGSADEGVDYRTNEAGTEVDTYPW